MTWYATLEALRRVLGLAADQTADDDLLRAALAASSRLIEGFTGRRFAPEQATRRYRVPAGNVLLLDGDLLALDAVINGDGSTIPADALHLHPAAGSVKTSLELDRTRATFVHSGDPVGAIQVSGLWGYHPDWASAWRDSGDSVQDAPLSADAAALTVNDAGGADSAGESPRFSVGQLLRIESEMVQVLAVDGEDPVLTVERGACGTTAAVHAQGQAIAIYQPPADVRQACLRVASWLYRQRDAGFVQVAGGLRGQVSVPPALPEDVQQILAPHVRIRVG